MGASPIDRVPHGAYHETVVEGGLHIPVIHRLIAKGGRENEKNKYL